MRSRKPLVLRGGVAGQKTFNGAVTLRSRKRRPPKCLWDLRSAMRLRAACGE